MANVLGGGWWAGTESVVRTRLLLLQYWGSGQLLTQSHGSSPPQTPGLLMWLSFSVVCTGHTLPQCAQQVRNLPAMLKTQEIQVQSLGGEDPLQKEMATHSSIFAWQIPWTKETGGLQSRGSQRVGHKLK